MTKRFGFHSNSPGANEIKDLLIVDLLFSNTKTRRCFLCLVLQLYAACKKCFPFAPFQFVPLCNFELHKDWPVIIPVKPLLVKDVRSPYYFRIWDAYFQIRITGLTWHF